jgi:HSP20 family protein
LRRLDPEDRGFDFFTRDIESLHRGIDRLFEDVWGGRAGTSLLPELWSRRDVVPQLDVTEDEKAFHVTIELPGLDEKDVNVSLADRVLAISGEKKAEKEEKDKNAYRRERAYGSFRRALELPGEVDAERIEAKFNKGVLTIDLPKTKEAQQKATKIPVKAA